MRLITRFYGTPKMCLPRFTGGIQHLWCKNDFKLIYEYVIKKKQTCPQTSLCALCLCVCLWPHHLKTALQYLVETNDAIGTVFWEKVFVGVDELYWPCLLCMHQKSKCWARVFQCSQCRGKLISCSAPAKTQTAMCSVIRLVPSLSHL